MSYARIETSALRHPKIRALSDGAFRLWVAGLAYAQEALTDGVLDGITSKVLGCPVNKTRIKELEKVGLWVRVGGQIRIHDYAIYNDLKDEVERKRAVARKRYARWRSSKNARIGNRPSNGVDNASATALSNAYANAFSSIDIVQESTSPPFVPKNSDARGSSTVSPPLAAWDDFRAVARAHGVDHRLPSTQKEYGHLLALTGAYSGDELHAMFVVFWTSAYLPGNRNLGLCAQNAGALFKHVTDRLEPRLFGAPVNAKDIAEAAREAEVDTWVPPSMRGKA